ncbi:MAG: DEAD/DEAH box helicase [Thaumarchaeota archaeon]|nr:DEAD/DEAH box helicase [Nitrososphaerota archaeon]
MLQRYRCPNCKSKLEIKRLFDLRYLLNCTKCSLSGIVLPSIDNQDEAYLSFLASYDKGQLPKDLKYEEVLQEEKVIRKENDIRRLVEDAGTALEKIPAPLRDALLSKSDYIVTYRIFEPQEPKFGCRPEEIPPIEPLSPSLKAIGIDRLYKFQEESCRAILDGKNVVIVAPTGAGKTEAFACPIIAKIHQEVSEAKLAGITASRVRALFVYPTKALTRDQIPKIENLAAPLGVQIAVFDGDIPKRERDKIIDESPDIIATNFDTVHAHLMNRTKFSFLLRRVKYLVVDEVHSYTGTFGTNVHFILKRLKRICGGFLWVAASATIENPKEFAQQLFGEEPELIESDQLRRSKMHFTMLFPSLRSHRSLALDLVEKTAKNNYGTIVFSSSHLGTELTAFYGRKRGINIAVHRAGLLANFRKTVEENFKKGLLTVIAATPTLELGIDIGRVDAIVSDLVPVTRLIQRTGRAGRRGQESLAFLVLRDSDPISQYYKNHPEDYFNDVEPGYIDPFNPVIADFHLLAASLDEPLKLNEFGEYENNIERLQKSFLLKQIRDKLFPDYKEVRKLLQNHNIRGIGESVAIKFAGKTIGERNMPLAMEELHKDAIYFLAGTRYRSKKFEFKSGAGYAEVERISPNYPYYTKALLDEWPTITHVFETKAVKGIEVSYCNLLIEKKVIGYVNIEIGKELGRGDRVMLEEPLSYKFTTKGFVFRAPMPKNALENSEEEEVDKTAMSAFHATEHVIIEGSNMITGGASQDMGGISLGTSGLIFVHDGTPGGNGASKALYDRLNKAYERGLKILSECPCSSISGCPRCTYSYRCGNNNEFLHKLAAKEVLERIRDGEETNVVEPLLGEKAIV